MNTLFFMLVAAVSAAATYKNPIIPTDAPDPGVIYYNGKYYIATTGTYYRLYESDDLATWTYIGTAFNDTTKPKWAISKYWAPELHVINGKLMLYFSANSTDGHFALGCATAPDPHGPWIAEDNYILTDDLGVIDVSIAKDEVNGVNYLLWKVDGNYYGLSTPFMIAQLDSTGTKIVEEPVQILINDLDWEYALIEGPFIIYENGYYYLFYSSLGAQGQSSYMVGVARSKNIKGPYEKMPVPILSQFSDKAASQYFVKPGHCSMIKVPTNGLWYMVYHSYVSGHISDGPGRIGLIDRVFFDEQGWPVVGVAGTPSCKDLPLPTSAEAANLTMDRRLVPGDKPIKLMCSQYDVCWGEDGYFDESCTTQFYVREGHLGHGTISLESVKSPGKFWRHSDNVLILSENDGSELFKKDSSFIPVAGLCNTDYVTLRPSNFMENVIRHSDKRIIMSHWDESELLGKDGSWRIVY